MPANQPAQPEQQQLLEDRLFRHFRGWTWSERARDTSSWLWDFGYDSARRAFIQPEGRIFSQKEEPKISFDWFIYLARAQLVRELVGDIPAKRHETKAYPQPLNVESIDSSPRAFSSSLLQCNHLLGFKSCVRYTTYIATVSRFLPTSSKSGHQL